jgi:predicted nucleotidyltransferase component of viral defense system
MPQLPNKYSMSKERISIEQIKKLVLIALVSDDELMDTLVLKGGNALLMVYDMSYRASWDLDFSISEDFKNFEDIKKRVHESIIETFRREHLHVFDISFEPNPQTPQEATKDFWGGYVVLFKVIEIEKIKELGGVDNINALRRNAVPINPNYSTKIAIDISKHEFVGDKQSFEIDGYTLYVYAPRLLAFEKVRAICQQIPEYSQIIPSFSPRARPRDFYDIYTLLENFEIDLASVESKDIMMNVFNAKKVPQDFLKKMKEHREIHKQDFNSLIDTVSIEEKENLKDFDFYFNYVIEKFEHFLHEE